MRKKEKKEKRAKREKQLQSAICQSERRRDPTHTHHTATITSITTKTKQKGWPSLPAEILGDAANLGSMTTIGLYALSVALMLIVLINTTTAKFSSVVASSQVEEGYLFRGDPKAKNVVEYHTDGVGSTNFDTAVADVDRVLEFYDPHCGACQLFASTYVKLADAAATKKSGSKSNPLPAKTQFHSVSCSQHHDVCEEYKITGFPTLLVLPKGGKTFEDAEPVSKDIVSGLVAGPGGYTLNSIAKALKKAEANLEDGEEEIEEDQADASVVSRRLEDEEGTDDDAMSADVEGDNDDIADGDSDNTDDDEASPEDADEWEKNDGPAPKATSTVGGARPLANPASAAAARDSTYTSRLRAAANAARAAAAIDNSPDIDESNEEAEEEEQEEKDDDAVTDVTDPNWDDEDSEDEDERPLAAAQKRAAVVSAKNKMAQMTKDIMDEDDSQEQEDGSATPLRDGKKTATTFGKEEEVRFGDDEDESREAPAPAKRVAATAATTARKTTFQKTSPRTIVAAERGAASGDDEEEEEKESPAFPPVKPSPDSPTVRKFAAIKKVSESEDEDEEDDESEANADSNDAENTDDNDDEVSDEDDKDDDDEVRKDQNDDEVPSVDDETTEGEDAFVAARPQPPPGQVRPGASPPFTGGTTGMVPAGGPAGAAARAKFLAKTGMQPKDIQQYQQVAAQRRANLAQKAQKRIPPVFQGKKAAAARKQAAQALKKEKQSPVERQRLAQERAKKNKELLQKRIEMAKKIREQKRLAAANGAARVPTTERVRSQGGPTFKKTTPTRAELKQNTIGKKPSVPKKILSSVPIVKRAFKPKPEEDLYGDAALSFVTGLKMGVYTDGRPLDQKRQQALVDWLELLSISLPPELGLHALIDDLLSNMSYITQGREKLYEQLDKYPLANKYWSDSCSKRRKGQGQNCGLWKLLHIVTIGFAEHRGGLEQQDGSYVDVPMTSGPTFTPNQGAAIIREYIALFFGCDVCKNNFLSKYDDCVSFGRCDRMPVDARIGEVEDEDWKELPLWLWEFHNHIAARIVQVKARRDGGRDDEVIGIWPNAETCFSCYNIDGSWNMEELYAFLETTYWYASSSSDFKLDRFLKDFDKAQRISSSSSSSGGSGGGSFANFALIGIVAFGFYASKRKNVWLADIQKHTSIPIARNGAAGKKA